MRHVRHATRRKAAPAWAFFIFIPVAFLWMELVFRLFVLDTFFSSGLFLTIMIVLPLSIVAYLLCTLGSEKTNRRVTIVLLALASLIVCSQVVYHGVFDTFWIVYSIKNAG